MTDTAFQELVERGVAAHQKNEFDAAYAAYRQALDMRPGDAEIQSLTGLVLVQLGRLDEAMPLLRGATEAEPSQSGFRLNLVEGLVRQGDSANALRELDRVLDADQGNARAWERRGDICALAGHREDAANAWATAFNLQNRNPVIGMKLARALAAQRNFDGAHRILDHVENTAGQGPVTYELRCAMLTEQLDWPGLEAVARLWVNVDAANPAAWHRLTQSVFEQGLYLQAKAAYEQVLEHSPRTAVDLTSYGRICLHAHDYEAAAAALEEAATLEPDNVEMLAARALLATYRGDFAAAEADCRRAIERNPEYAPAYTQLTRLTRGRLSDSERSALARVVADEKAPVENRVTAHFALAHALDEAGDLEGAYAAYAAANARQHEQNRKENLEYDRARTEARTEELIERFQGEAGSAAAKDGPVPIFIVGMPRSGTTLLESLFAAHPAVTAGGERVLMPQLLEAYLQLARDKRATDDLPEQLARIYLSESPASSAYVTDKLPLNFEALGLISRMFPNAVMINIRRSPLETGLSIFRHEFLKFWRFAHRLEDIGHYYGQYCRLMAHWQSVLGERLIDLSYEALAADFDNVAPSVIAAAGLPWNDACASFQSYAPVIATFSAVQAREPVSVRKGKAFAYRKFLEPLAEALREAGVDPETGAYEP